MTERLIEPVREEEDEAMAESAWALADAVVGHRIVSAENGSLSVDLYGSGRVYDASGLILTLDNGSRVLMRGQGDCCAFAEVEAFLLNPCLVDHVITGVATEDGYQKWFVYADMGDVLKLTVDWSSGNFPYYAYGFSIHVVPEA